MSRTGKPTKENYYDFAHAIVRQACRDYKIWVNALLKNKAKGDTEERGYVLGRIKSIRNDFESEWFYLLGVNDAKSIIARLHSEVRVKRKSSITKARARQKGSF